MALPGSLRLLIVRLGSRRPLSKPRALRIITESLQSIMQRSPRRALWPAVEGALSNAGHACGMLNELHLSSSSEQHCPLRPLHTARIHSVDVRKSEKAKNTVDLGLEDLDRMGSAGFAPGRQSIQGGAAQHRCVRAQEPCLHNIRPAAEAAIDQYGEPVSHCGSDVRQDLHRRNCAVELAAAMIGQHDPVYATLRRKPRILNRENSLYNQLPRPPLAQPLDVLPVQ